MTIREYAISRAISYEAAAKQVRKYKTKELKKHIKYKDRTAELDEYAVNFLDEHRQPKNIVVTASDSDTQREVERLQDQVTKLQAELLKRTDKINELLEEKTLLIEDKTRVSMLAAELQETKQELDSYKPVFLGFYRKTKSHQPTDQTK